MNRLPLFLILIALFSWGFSSLTAMEPPKQFITKEGAQKMLNEITELQQFAEKEPTQQWRWKHLSAKISAYNEIYGTEFPNPKLTEIQKKIEHRRTEVSKEE